MTKIILIALAGSLFAGLNAAAASKKKISVKEPCRLVDEGPVGQEWKNLRIERQGQVVTGTDRLETAVGLLEQLHKDKVCPLASQNCEMKGEGVVGGQWSRHRLMVDGRPVAGADDLGTISSQFAELRRIGVCVQ